jgi:hypothetical protein
MYRETAGNIQLTRHENIHSEKKGEFGAKRRYIRSREIEKLAVEKYQENGLGITYNDLVARGIAGNKREAQLKLKNCLRLKILFVYEITNPKDTSRVAKWRTF